jgi:hypothetical protein
MLTHMLAHTYSNQAENLKDIDAISPKVSPGLYPGLVAELELQKYQYPNSGHLLLLWYIFECTPAKPY